MKILDPIRFCFCLAICGFVAQAPWSSAFCADQPRNAAEVVRGLRTHDDIGDAERKFVVQTILHEDWERSLCELLDAMIPLEKLPVDFIEAVEERFQLLPGDDEFAKARAAAILMKWRPTFEEACVWIEKRLNSDSKHLRALAAMAISWVGPAAKDVVPKLNALLQDQSATVRVTAARALFRITDDADAVLDTLLDSLAVEGETVSLRPIGFSEWTGDHRHLAAATLGQMKNGSEKAAVGLCRLLEDEELELRWVALGALESLGCKSDSVLKSLERLEIDKNKIVANKAKKTLQALTSDKR